MGHSGLSRSLLATLAASWLVACGSSGSSPGGGDAETDATSSSDASPDVTAPADSGAPGADGSSEGDSGAPPSDSGSTPPDSSTQETDSGAPQDSGGATLDASTPDGSSASDAGPDSGTPPPDSGMTPGPLVFRGAFVGGGAAPATNQNVHLHGVFLWHGAVSGQANGVRLVGWLH
jgi:hypothetical protein